MNTKDKILYSALELFSKHGYLGVVVDQIAEKVGIKGPSLYKHFKNKEEIFTSAINMGNKYYSEHFGLKEGKKLPENLQELKALSKKQVHFTVTDKTVCMCRKLLNLEQFRSEKLGEISSKQIVIKIENLYTEYFKHLINNGVLKADSPKMLSISFTYPISSIVQMCDRQPNKKQEYLKTAEQYIDWFINRL